MHDSFRDPLEIDVDEFIGELNEWYTAWLNVTETFTMPNKPEWLK